MPTQEKELDTIYPIGTLLEHVDNGRRYLVIGYGERYYSSISPGRKHTTLMADLEDNNKPVSFLTEQCDRNGYFKVLSEPNN